METMDRLPQRSANEADEPICTYGRHVIQDDEYYYIINPLGGYGRDEVLCCERCIRRPQNADARARMIEAGAKELLDS